MDGRVVRFEKDIPYKGHIIGTTVWDSGPVYRVYPDDLFSVNIEYEGTSVEDCMSWIDSQGVA